MSVLVIQVNFIQASFFTSAWGSSALSNSYYLERPDIMQSKDNVKKFDAQI